MLFCAKYVSLFQLKLIRMTNANGHDALNPLRISIWAFWEAEIQPQKLSHRTAPDTTRKVPGNRVQGTHKRSHHTPVSLHVFCYTCDDGQLSLEDQLSSLNLRLTFYQPKKEIQSTIVLIMAQTLGQGTVTHVHKDKMKSPLLFSYVQYSGRNFACPETSYTPPGKIHSHISCFC